MNTKTETTTWPDLAIGLYDKLTGRNAEITYRADDLKIDVPAGTSHDSPRAQWVVNGGLTISTRDRTNG